MCYEYFISSFCHVKQILSLVIWKYLWRGINRNSHGTDYLLILWKPDLDHKTNIWLQVLICEKIQLAGFKNIESILDPNCLDNITQSGLLYCNLRRLLCTMNRWIVNCDIVIQLIQQFSCWLVYCWLAWTLVNRYS